MSDDDSCQELEELIHRINVLGFETNRLFSQLTAVRSQQEELEAQVQRVLATARATASRERERSANIVTAVPEPVEPNIRTGAVIASNITLTNQERGTLDIEIPYTKDFLPKVGDEVRILNPKRGQQNKGVIEGFQRNGYARIRCRTQVIIRNIKNIVLTTQVQQYE